MKEYSLQQLLTYIDCPLKYKMQFERKLHVSADLSSNTIISSALADTYLKACHLFAQGRPYSVQERTKFFSRTWTDLKEVFMSNGGEESRAHTQLITSHNKVIGMTRPVPNGWDVGVVNFPTEKIIDNYMIKDSIDVALINKADTRYINLIFLDRSLSKESENNFAVLLRAMFNLHYFKNELSGTPGLKVRCSVLNLHHGYQKVLNLKPEVLSRYRHTLVVIIHSIEANLYYPRAGTNECKHCLFSNSCHFSSK